MSDARAKAEARRAKILARENKHVSAVTVDLNDSEATEAQNETNSQAQTKSKDRPIASRRNYVSTLNPKGESSESINRNNNGQANSSDEVQAVGVTPIVGEKEVSAETEGHVDTEKKVEFTPSAVKEIEKEIAENTAKFDAQTLKKDEDKSKSKIQLKPKVVIPSNIHPTSVLRLLRLIVLSVIAIHIGFQTSKLNRIEAASLLQRGLEVQSNSNLEESLEFNSALSSSQSLSAMDPIAPAEALKGRTWLGWLLSLIRGQLECAVTAVGLVSWLVGGVLGPYVNNKFAVKVNKGNILTSLFEMYANGFEGLFEYIYGWFGEIALYIFAIIASTVVFSIALEDVSQGSAEL